MTEPSPPAKRLPRPRPYLRAALSLGSVAVVLLVFEIALRLTTPRVVQRLGLGKAPTGAIQSNPALLARETARGKRLVPNAHVTIVNHKLNNRDIDVDVNSLGFRGAELPASKPPEERRILVLGDSITLADYIQESESFVARMGHHLQEKQPRGRILAINGGVGDIGLKEEIDILEDQGLAAKPDIVIIAFYLNDSRPPWGFPGELGEAGWLRRHSALADTLYRQGKMKIWLREKGKARWQWTIDQHTLDWAHDRAAFGRLAESAGHDWGAAWREDSWPAIEAGFARLKALGEANGFRAAIVAFPVAFQVNAEFLDDVPQRRVEKIAADFGFPYLDLLPLLRARKGERIYFDQCHPNVEANDWIGKAMADFVAEKFGDGLGFPERTRVE